LLRGKQVDIRAFSFEEIPSEFRIEAYDLCAGWGVAEWASALTDRQFGRVALATDQRIGNVDGEGGLHRVILEKSLSFMEIPLHGSRAGTTPFNGHHSPIRDQSAWDFFDGLYAAHDSRYEKFAQLAAKSTDDDVLETDATASRQELTSVAAWQMHRECGVHDDGCFLVSVDLGASDEHLIGEFKRWIKATRTAAGLSKIPHWYTAADFAKWHEMRFLAYLDLTFWARARGGHFTLPVLGKALFPTEFNVGLEDRIRKVVAPGASAIVTDEAVSALNAQRLNADGK
jgi:hypothetical protein